MTKQWVAIALLLNLGLWSGSAAIADESQLNGIPLSCYLRQGPLDLYIHQAFNTYDWVSFESQQWKEIVLAYAAAGDLKRAVMLTEKLDGELTDDRQESLIAISDNYATAGDYRRAQRLAKRIVTKPAFAVKLRARVARHAATAGDGKQAEQVFATAMRLAETLEPWERDRALVYIAVERAAATQIDAALALLQHIEDEGERAWATAQIAVELSRLGQFERALQWVITMQDEYHRGEALAALAQHGTGESLSQVLTQVQALTDRTYRHAALSAIAKRYIVLNQFDAATELAKVLHDEGWLLSPLVEQYAAVGRFDLALAEFERIENPFWRRPAVAAIARQYAATDQYDQALQFAATLESPELEILALRAIAQQQTETEQYDRALVLYNRVLTFATSIHPPAEHPPQAIHGIQTHFIPLIQCAQRNKY